MSSTIARSVTPGSRQRERRDHEADDALDEPPAPVQSRAPVVDGRGQGGHAVDRGVGREHQDEHRDADARAREDEDPEMQARMPAGRWPTKTTATLAGSAFTLDRA